MNSELLSFVALHQFVGHLRNELAHAEHRLENAARALALAGGLDGDALVIDGHIVLPDLDNFDGRRYAGAFRILAAQAATVQEPVHSLSGYELYLAGESASQTGAHAHAE